MGRGTSRRLVEGNGARPPNFPSTTAFGGGPPPHACLGRDRKGAGKFCSPPPSCRYPIGRPGARRKSPRRPKIRRAHVQNPATNANHECPPLLEKNKQKQTQNKHKDN